MSPKKASSKVIMQAESIKSAKGLASDKNGRLKELGMKAPCVKPVSVNGMKRSVRSSKAVSCGVTKLPTPLQCGSSGTTPSAEKGCVYLVHENWHSQEVEEPHLDVGAYSTPEKANAAVLRRLENLRDVDHMDEEMQETIRAKIQAHDSGQLKKGRDGLLRDIYIGDEMCEEELHFYLRKMPLDGPEVSISTGRAAMQFQEE